jgi:cellulose biosynthesis protein BcsQ
MTKSICMFNHKGGVGKTTNCYGLGWMLGEKGKRVILIDADSQCNLTNIFVGDEEFDKFYIEQPERNIESALSPPFDGKPVMIEAFECVEARGNKNLFLIPGSYELSRFEVSLGISFTLSEAMPTLKNLPGSFAFLISKTAEKYGADYVIVDMNPSLSAINQALLVSCDYFIVPTSPDNFSTMAIESLSKILPTWEKWAIRARKLLSDAIYPLPNSTPRFLGTIIQRFNIRKGNPTQASQEMINGLSEIVKTIFVTELSKFGMMAEKTKYEADNFCLAEIPDFQTLNAVYQNLGIPVFALSDKQLHHAGVVLEQYQAMRKRFHEKYSDLADIVIRMTSDE